MMQTAETTRSTKKTATLTIGPDVLDGGPPRQVEVEVEQLPAKPGRAMVTMPGEPFEVGMPATLDAALADVRAFLQAGAGPLRSFAQLVAPMMAPDASPNDRRRAVLDCLAGADYWAALATHQLDDGPTVGEALAVMRDDPDALARVAAWRVVLRDGVPDADVLDRVRCAARNSADAFTRELSTAALRANAWARVVEAENTTRHAVGSLARVLDDMAAIVQRLIPDGAHVGAWRDACTMAKRAAAAFDPPTPRPTVETITLPADPLLGDVRPVRCEVRRGRGAAWFNPFTSEVLTESGEHGAPSSLAEVHTELVRFLEVDNQDAFLQAMAHLVEHGHRVEGLNDTPEKNARIAAWLELHLAAYALGDGHWQALDRRDDVLALLDSHPLARPLAAVWRLVLRKNEGPQLALSEHQRAQLHAILEPFEDDPTIGRVVEEALAPDRREARKAAKAQAAAAR